MNLFRFNKGSPESHCSLTLKLMGTIPLSFHESFLKTMTLPEISLPHALLS